MKKLFIYSLALGNFLFTLHPVFSQASEPLVNANTDKGQSDPKSEEILKKVSAIYKGYKPQFYLRTTDITGQILKFSINNEEVEMIMPGDTVSMQIELLLPIAIETGMRFAIREGGKTVGSGLITNLIL